MKIFRNRTVIGVLCILLALIICFGVTPLFSRSASEKTEIVRVTMDLSLIHISEPTRPSHISRMPSSA